MIKAAIYVRVSTMMQADKDSLPMQRRDLINYAQLILHADSYEIFEDAGFSAKNTDRPAYQRMMISIRAGGFTHLLVWKLDRISRNLLDFAGMHDELKKLRVTFISLNEQFDTSSAMGEAMLKIILVFAELERKLTSERVTATMISRATSGQWNGGHIAFGYQYVDMQFQIVDDEVRTIRTMLELFLSTKSLSKTAICLNNQGLFTRNGAPWKAYTVYRILTNPFYAGDLRYNAGFSRSKKPEDEWVIVRDHHPAIFSRDEEARIKAVCEENRKLIRRGAKTRSAFHRLVFCGICGSVMYVMTESPRDGFTPIRFLCPMSRVKANCDNQSLREAVIGETVINTINAVIYAQGSEEISSPEDLENLLFSLLPDVSSVSGVDALFSHIRKRTASHDYIPDAPFIEPEDTSMRDELARQRRALERLQELYLYSDQSMTRTDYMSKREAILSRITELESLLEKENKKEEGKDVFIYMGSNVILSAVLGTGEKISYQSISRACDPDVLHAYFSHVIREVTVFRGRVSGITFINGYSLGLDYRAQ